MDQVVDSRQKMLSVNEILQIAAQHTGIGKPTPEIMKKFLIELALPGTHKFRNGNTIFLIHADRSEEHTSELQSH